MKHDVFHDKIVELTRRNLKNMKVVSQQTSKLKHQLSSDLTTHLSNHQRQYEQLLKLAKQSQQQQLRLKREITMTDAEIEQLQMKSNLGRSRIKIQSEEIENIKDETYDIDRQRRKDDRIQRVNNELRECISKGEEDVESWQIALKNTQNSVMQLQTYYQGLIQKKELMNKSRKQSHRQNKSRIQELETHLRQLKSQASSLRILKQKYTPFRSSQLPQFTAKSRLQQQKTRRINKAQTLSEIAGMIRNYKQSHR